jgi:hypothetical protein
VTATPRAGFPRLAAVLAVLAALTLPASAAFATAPAAPTVSPSPSAACVENALYDAGPGDIAMVYTSEVETGEVVHNRADVAIGSLIMDVGAEAFVVEPASGSVPSLRWSVDGGAWRAASLHRYGNSPGAAQWISADIAAPVFAPHGEHTFRIRFTFTKADVFGLYNAFVSFGSLKCAGLGFETRGMQFEYEPTPAAVHTAVHQANPGGSASSAGPSQIRVPASSSAPTSSPSASASPSVGVPTTAAPVGTPSLAAGASRAARSAVRITAGATIAVLCALFSITEFVRWRRLRDRIPAA